MPSFSQLSHAVATNELAVYVDWNGKCRYLERQTCAVAHVSPHTTAVCMYAESVWVRRADSTHAS